AADDRAVRAREVCGEPGRGRDHGELPGDHLPPFDERGGARLARSRSGNGPRVGRDRGPGRHRRGLRASTRRLTMSAYTLLQLVEVVVATAVLLIGVLSSSAPLTLLGGGLLMGKAILNILAPEGGSVYRRSLIGYGVA